LTAFDHQSIIASDVFASKHQISRLQKKEVNTMRTTLDIEDSVLNAVKEMARRQGKTAGEVLSTLARQALTRQVQSGSNAIQETQASYGFRPLPPGEILVTNETIDKLRDEQGV
jgi:hypothetical protein